MPRERHENEKPRQDKQMSRQKVSREKNCDRKRPEKKSEKQKDTRKKVRRKKMPKDRDAKRKRRPGKAPEKPSVSRDSDDIRKHVSSLGFHSCQSRFIDVKSNRIKREWHHQKRTSRKKCQRHRVAANGRDNQAVRFRFFGFPAFSFRLPALKCPSPGLLGLYWHPYIYIYVCIEFDLLNY